MQATSLRSQLHVVEASLDQTRRDLSETKELLSSAESRADRIRREAQIELEKRALALAQNMSTSAASPPKNGDESESHSPKVKAEDLDDQKVIEERFLSI